MNYCYTVYRALSKCPEQLRDSLLKQSVTVGLGKIRSGWVDKVFQTSSIYRAAENCLVNTTTQVYKQY
jgi:hypothetical protein